MAESRAPQRWIRKDAHARLLNCLDASCAQVFAERLSQISFQRDIPLLERTDIGLTADSARDAQTRARACIWPPVVPSGPAPERAPGVKIHVRA